MAASPEPGPNLGVFVVVNGDESRCRPDAVRKYFSEEVGNCRIVTSSRSYNNDKSFVTLEFSTPRYAQMALNRAGSKIYGCRISVSPFRSRSLGNLLGQENRFGQNNPRFNNQFNRGGRFQHNFNQRGGFQPHFKKGRSWGEQESDKVRGMSPKTAARYIENRIKEKEDKTTRHSRKTYSRSRSRSHSPSRSRSHSRSRSRSPSYRRRYSSHSSASRSRSRSPLRRKKSRRSRSASSASSVDSYRRRTRRSPSESLSDSEERRSKERKRRQKKRRRRHRSESVSEHADERPPPDLVQEMEEWASRDLEAPHMPEVTAEEVVPNEVSVLDEVTTQETAVAPAASLSPQLSLPIPSSLPLPAQERALQKRHEMQQEFEADVSTITSVTEMLQRHDQSIAGQLRNALRSVVTEVTTKYSAEFQEYLKTV